MTMFASSVEHVQIILILNSRSTRRGRCVAWRDPDTRSLGLSALGTELPSFSGHSPRGLSGQGLGWLAANLTIGKG